MSVCSRPISNYMTLTLRQVGFDPFVTNLLTIPYSVMNIIFNILIAVGSQRFQNVSLITSLQVLWMIPPVLALRFWSGAVVEPWPTFVLMTIALGYPSTMQMTVPWGSYNSNRVNNRTLSLSLTNLVSQAGNTVGSNVYQESDAPKYHRGNSVILTLSFVVLLILACNKIWYMRINKKRDETWNSMTREQHNEYITTTTDKGNRRLDFRFMH